MIDEVWSERTSYGLGDAACTLSHALFALKLGPFLVLRLEICNKTSHRLVLTQSGLAKVSSTIGTCAREHRVSYLCSV